MGQREILLAIAGLLDKQKIPYLLTGSFDVQKGKLDLPYLRKRAAQLLVNVLLEEVSQRKSQERT